MNLQPAPLTSANSKSPSIAIIGAGLAGVSFAIACQNKGLKYTLYESGPEIWQHGSGIGIAANGVEALNLIDPKLSRGLANVQSQKSTNGGLRYIFGHDGPTWRALETLGSQAAFDAKTLRRSDFMNMLTPCIPQNCIEFSKHLEALTELPSGQVVCQFRDGTSATHDVVVGADGIHSKTRSLLLGKEDPDCTPRFTGKVIHRAVVPTELVKAELGEGITDLVTGFLGDHGHIVMIPIDGGKTCSLVGVASRTSWPHKKWLIEGTVEELRSDYEGWDPKILHIMEHADNMDIWALFDLPFVHSFTKGATTLLGDAAHASTPFQANGTSMALEDAYVLAEVLEHAAGQSPGHLRAALRAYDAVRRPRTQKQVYTALEAGWLMEFEHPRFGRDPDLIRAEMETRMQWLWDVSLVDERDRAVRLMDEACAGFD